VGQTMEIGLYVALGVLALPFRYYLSETQACKVIGVAISDTGTKTGFQDAISPPSSTGISFAVWALILGCLGYLAYEFGWGAMGIGVAVFFVVGLIAGASFIPKPSSDHFLERIIGSMTRRHADYEKNNDTIRATAMQDLLMKVSLHYEDDTRM